MSDPNSPVFRFQVWRAALPTALRWLLTVNVATYLVYVALSIVGQGDLLRWLALPLTPAETLVRPWTVLTYGIANVYPTFWGLITFAFGVLWLNWLGRDVEETYGSHQLLGVYVFATLTGAALALAAGAFAPGPGGLGVWAGVWGPMIGVLCMLATMQPNRGIGLFLLGVVPLKWIAIVFVVLEMAFSKDPTHLGAAVGGFVFAKAQQRGVQIGSPLAPLFGVRRRRPEPSAPARSRTVDTRRQAPKADLDVDRILDKILEDGYDSLTPDERRALDDASRD